MLLGTLLKGLFTGGPRNRVPSTGIGVALSVLHIFDPYDLVLHRILIWPDIRYSAGYPAK